MDDPQCQYDPRSCQSLLGYGRAAHVRSGGICAYCDLGKERADFGVWRQLSVDHVVPAGLFPGEGRTLQSVFPNLPKSELKKLAEEVNEINLVTACNFCNSMTSRMNGISADGILSPEDYGELTSVDAEPVRDMLRRLEERVKKVLPEKKNRVRRCLAELRKTFDEEVRPELEDARDRPELKSEVLAEIDRFREQLIGLRAFTPRVDTSLIGHWAYPSAELFAEHGYKVFFVFPEPLTNDDIDRLNANGHFINQSYLVFLCSVLEFHHVLVHKEPVDKRLDGADDVRLLRDLRNVVAHRAGEYDASKKEHRRLYEKLQKLYGIDPGADPQSAQAFPLPIDEVLLPMTKHCREYAEALLQSVGTCALSE